MKVFFSLLLSVSIFTYADVIKCPVENYVVIPKEFFYLLRQFPQTFMTVKITNLSGNEKPIHIQAGSEAESALVEGKGLSVGDRIKTKSGQTVELKFFMPTEQVITISENSEIQINQLPTTECQSAIEVLRGGITSEGSHHRMLEIERCASETQTENVEIRPTGTKYSVDLSEAISEASGEPLRIENYSVEKGSIQIKLRKARVKSNTLRVAKNGAFKLRAGQKAKVKINSKTKIADVQVLEP